MAGFFIAISTQAVPLKTAKEHRKHGLCSLASLLNRGNAMAKLLARRPEWTDAACAWLLDGEEAEDTTWEEVDQPCSGTPQATAAHQSQGNR